MAEFKGAMEYTDTCPECGTTMPVDYTVCSKKCAGKRGGRNGNTGGFYANRELAVSAGRKGGTNSRRGKRE